MKIKHLRNNAIDYELWDNCITHSHNYLAYACTWYLDIVSPGWEALVAGNYDYVMPLPIKSKYNISYLVQPVLTQQLGIFSKKEITNLVVEEFIKEIPYFSYELNLNEYNFCVKAQISPNLVLNLNNSYTDIYSKYSTNTTRNIEKARKKRLSIKEDIPCNEFVNFYFSVNKQSETLPKTLLEKIVEKGLSKNGVKLYGVFDEEDDQIAGLCVLRTPKRHILLIQVSNAIGKAYSAMFYLIDFLICTEAGKGIEFDFEGSKIEGIARFYKGFGAKNHPYYTLKKFRPSFLIGK